MQYNDLTHFIGITEASLSIDDRIEVSGYLNANSEFIATYIELDDDGLESDYQYTVGQVRNLDRDTRTFMLNNLVVDYSSIAVAELQEGDVIRISGAISNGVIYATELKFNNDDYYTELTDQTISRVEIEGYISAYDATAQTLTVNGVKYLLDTNTVLIGSNAIALQDFVEIYVNPTTKMIYQIEFKNSYIDHDGTTKGVISAIDQAAQTIVVNGISYSFTATTRFEDDNDKYFGFSSLALYDRVEIAFSTSASNTMLIQRIERESENEFHEEWEIEGFASSFDAASQQLTVNGLQITVSDSGRYLIDDRLVSAQEFFSMLAAKLNTRIEVEGHYDEVSGFVAYKAELEDYSGTSTDQFDSSEPNSDSDDYEHIGSDEDGTSDEYSDNNFIGVGYVELEGKVTALIANQSFALNGFEIRIDSNTELEWNDRYVSAAQFMSAITVGTRVEVEGVWKNNAYIQAFEAEIEDYFDD